MSKPGTYNRREFLKVSAGVSAGFMVAINLNACSGDHRTGTKDGTFSPNAWLSITPDNNITVIIAEADMGQGVLTALPMLIAEELDADWSTIKVQLAPMDPVYGYQVTGGSDTIRKAWQPMREAGAVARAMLVNAAAQTWKVPASECETEAGLVLHKASQRRISYGELTAVASTLPVPSKVPLKSPEQFRVLGRNFARLDHREKITGATVYGTDVQLPGLLHAAIKHCPVFGGKLMSVDAVETMKINGVKSVVEMEAAVAVVADNYWLAQKGVDALRIEWSESTNAHQSSDSLREAMRVAVNNNDKVEINTGDTNAIIKAAYRIVEANYEVPLQAHATMEPMNCTVQIKDGFCDIWVPTQEPSGVMETAFNQLYSGIRKKIEKLKLFFTDGQHKKIRLHKTVLGGGFGRRFNSDFVVEAIAIAKTVDVPVKLMWSREEDLQHDFYRPVTYHQLKAALDENGLPIAWSHQTAGAKGLTAGKVVYDIKNVFSSVSGIPSSVPLGAWRSVKHSYHAFAIECFIDELAHAAHQDPVAYRLKLLQKEPRLQHVIEVASAKSNWQQPAPSGQFRGIAAVKGFGSYIAQVAEVSVNNDGTVKVHRIVCAFDCGMIVNPDIIRAQIEGGIIFGLTATLKSAITIKDGKVEQSNFHDFPLLRIDETPQIDVHLVSNNEAPGGVGEPPVPPVAPAVANAVFAATGKRPRILPIRL